MSQYEPMGSSSVQDDDLLDMHVQVAGTISWVVAVLEELQFLRDLAREYNLGDLLSDDAIDEYQESAERKREELDDLAREPGDVDARIEYLEGVLDKLGAAYDREE